MNEHSTALLAGIITGVLAGLLLAAFVLKKTKTDGSIRCKYDERQKTARGDGYRYGFFTALIGTLVYGILSSGGVAFPMESGICAILIALLAILVQVGYCIWHDAYIALNENRGKILIAFTAIGIFNLALGIMNVVTGVCFTDGMLNFRSLNLFCGLMMLGICMLLLLKRTAAGSEDEE